MSTRPGSEYTKQGSGVLPPNHWLDLHLISLIIQIWQRFRELLILPSPATTQSNRMASGDLLMSAVKLPFHLNMSGWNLSAKALQWSEKRDWLDLLISREPKPFRVAMKVPSSFSMVWP